MKLLIAEAVSPLRRLILYQGEQSVGVDAEHEGGARLGGGRKGRVSCSRRLS